MDDEWVLERTVDGKVWYGRVYAAGPPARWDWCHCPAFATRFPAARRMNAIMHSVTSHRPRLGEYRAVPYPEALAAWKAG